MIATYEYDPYGNVISSTGSIIGRSGYFGYAGEYTDRESKLVYLRARYYDPSTQQFINRDPLVGATGQPYSYAGGSPVNATDPTGMWLESAIDIASLIAGLADINENGLNWGNGIGLVADVVSLALPVVGGVGFAVRAVAHADDIGDAGRLVSNPASDRLARVIPGDTPRGRLGGRHSDDPNIGVFVTAAEDIAGMNARQIAKRLAIEPSDVYTVIEFSNPLSGLASPIRRNQTYSKFVGRGRTLGGAREFVIPNGPIPLDATIRFVR